MKSLLWIATLVFIVFGFAMPMLWAAAIVTAFLAIGASPEGKREDGKAKTGGLLGGLWDSTVVGATMKDCDHCKSKIPVDATVCKHCTRDQTPSS